MRYSQFSLAFILLGTALAVGTLPLRARAQTIYVSDFSTGHVGTFDSSTGVVTQTAITGVPLTDIAFNPVNRLFYAMGYDDNLYTFSPTTGATTLIGNDGGIFIEGLGFRNDGVLVGGTNNSLFTINTGTGAATLTRTYSGSGQGADLVFDDSGNLYISTADTHIYKFTDFQNSSIYTDLGTTGLPDGGVALAYDGSLLYVFDNGVSEYSVFNLTNSNHTVSAYSSNLGSIVGGATFVPSPTSVPEPGSVALLAGMGISGVGFLARRRKNARIAA